MQKSKIDTNSATWHSYSINSFLGSVTVWRKMFCVLIYPPDIPSVMGPGGLHPALHYFSLLQISVPILIELVFIVCLQLKY